MDIELTTIIIGCSVLLLSVVSSFFSPFFRRPAVNDTLPDNNGAKQEHPHISIVMSARNQGDVLKKNLPRFLEQDYPKDAFEVIVVNESSTDNTEDELKLLKAQHANLYTTFIPESSHYLSRRKLALTLGVKAAKNEWIVFVDAASQPVSSNWLTTLASYCNAENDIVCGYSNYDTETSKAYHRFRHLHTALYQMRTAMRSQAYRYEGAQIAFRRQMFMQNNGFLKNLMYLRGEYDFIANEYSCEGRTAVMNAPDGILCQDAPTPREWKNSQLFYMETRRHLRRTLPWRVLHNTDTFMQHINWLAVMATLACSLLTSDYILTAAAAAAFIITALLRTTFIMKASDEYSERLPMLGVLFMENSILWHNLWLMIIYKCSDKYDFIRK